MLATMRRVDIVVPRTRAAAAIRTIHRVGVLHPAPSGPPPGDRTRGLRDATGPAHDPPVRARARARRPADRAGGFSSPAAPGDVATLWELPDEALFARVADLGSIEDEAARLAAERVRLEGEIARLDGYRQLIAGLARVVGRLPPSAATRRPGSWSRRATAP